MKQKRFWSRDEPEAASLPLWHKGFRTANAHHGRLTQPNVREGLLLQRMDSRRSSSPADVIDLTKDEKEDADENGKPASCEVCLFDLFLKRSRVFSWSSPGPRGGGGRQRLPFLSSMGHLLFFSDATRNSQKRTTKDNSSSSPFRQGCASLVVCVCPPTSHSSSLVFLIIENQSRGPCTHPTRPPTQLA